MVVVRIRVDDSKLGKYKSPEAEACFNRLRYRESQNDFGDAFDQRCTSETDWRRIRFVGK